MTTPPAIPGPSGGIMGLKNVLAFQDNPINFLMSNVHAHNSDIITWQFGPQYDVYLLRNPAFVRELLVRQAVRVKRWERMAKTSRKIAGANLFASDGDSWMQQRRLIAPAFHTQRIKHYIDLMVKHTQQLITAWDDGSIQPMHAQMTAVTMNIIGEILFDIDNISEDARELSEALAVLLEMFMLESTAIMPLPDWVPSPRNLRENQAMKISREYLMEIIRQRRAEGVDHGDVMSALLQAVDEDDGDQMTDEQVWSELMGLFIAGHETTAILMTWALYSLAQQPRLQDKLYAEVSSVMQGSTPTLDDLEAMTYTDSVLKETLRRYPPAWSLVVREVVTPVELGEHTLPEGALIYISPWVQHHDPRYWDDPQTFDPARFEGDWKQNQHNYSYLPFGGGSRVCIGAHMAEMEAEVILATLVKHFTFELAEPDQQVDVDPKFTLHPQGGMPLRVRKRS